MSTITMKPYSGAGRQAKVFSQHEIDYVKANHEYRTQAEMMTHLGMTRHHMKMLLRHLGLCVGKGAKKPFNRADCLDNYWMKKADNEIFDVHEMEWI